MNYPKLVKEDFCTVPCTVKIETEEISRYGEPILALNAELMCNWQTTAKTRISSDEQHTELTGIAYFADDIAPDLSEISSGTITIYGIERRIHKGFKGRNPDGTINYTMLEVI